MCGIFGLFDSQCEYHEFRKLVLKLVKKIRHRGPDDNGIVTKESVKNKGVFHAVCHERLAIIDPFAQKQPIFGSTEEIVTSTNGEIYNHQMIRSTMYGKYKILDENTCDVFVIPFLYEELNKDIEAVCNRLSGDWAFILYDQVEDRYYAARDHAGVCPAYVGIGKKNETIIASEMKALSGYCTDIQPVPPGHYYDGKTKQFYRWFKPNWIVKSIDLNKKLSPSEIQESFIGSLRERLFCDVPFGVWLNGSVESAITGAVTTNLLKEMNFNPNFSTNAVLHSFTIGFGKSKALENSKKIANFLGTIHHEIIFTPEEGTDVIEDVIYHLETYNPVDVRKGIEYYLCSKKIKSIGIKMVLNGDGADDLFGTQMDFHEGMKPEEMAKQFAQRYYDLALTDLVMANKASMAWGLEIRVPFVDRDFLNLIMDSDPTKKLINFEKKDKMSKKILREAFEDPEILPKELLWDAESDYQTDPNLLLAIEKLSELDVSDDDFSNRKIDFPFKTPNTKEEYMYRSIYDRFFKIKDTFSPFKSTKTSKKKE